jgi:putative endonuclease
MSRVLGNIAEDKACKFLQKNGFKIVDRNFYSKFGEIDIIALKNRVLHFIEVKSGKNFEPIYAITPTKIDRILKSINYYLLKNRVDFDYCVDAIVIKQNSIEFIENITIF